MEINEITQERIADKLLSAMKREGLMSKEVAKIFDIPASYMSSLIRNRDNVPQPAWVKFRDWEISGKPLRDYKMTREEKADFVTQSVEPIVKKATVRKEAKKNKKEMAEVISRAVTTEDGKTTIDIAELNQRTGTRVTVDILEGGYIIIVTNLPK